MLKCLKFIDIAYPNKRLYSKELSPTSSLHKKLSANHEKARLYNSTGLYVDRDQYLNNFVPRLM